MESGLLLGAFIIGLAGSVHCFGMCGGIVTLASLNADRNNKFRHFALAFLFNVGRITTYGLLGFIAGRLSTPGHQWTLTHSASSFSILSFINILILVLLGIYITRLWNGFAWLEKAGFQLYRLLQPVTQRILPVRKMSHSFLLGLTWGMMPCGMVYAAVLLASLTGDTKTSIMYMLLFGLGTLPAMLSMSLIGNRFQTISNHKLTRIILGLAIICLGLASFFLVDHSAHHSHHH